MHLTQQEHTGVDEQRRTMHLTQQEKEEQEESHNVPLPLRAKKE